MNNTTSSQQLNENALYMILGSECGWNDKEPESVGGASLFGIGRKIYADWRKNKCQITDAPMDIEGLAGNALEEFKDSKKYRYKNPVEVADKKPELEIRIDIVKAFYTDYFLKHHAELLPECLQFIHLDFATNAGYTANKVIQKMIGFVGDEVDGILGSGSRARMQEFTEDFEKRIQSDPFADNELIKEYDALKREHYHYLAEKDPVKHGPNLQTWLMRCDKVLAELQEYFDDPAPTPSAVDEEEVHFEVEVTPEPKTSKAVVTRTEFESLESDVTTMKSSLEEILNLLKTGQNQKKV